MIRAVCLDPLVRLGVPIPRLIADFVREGFGGISIDPGILLEATEAVRRDVAAAVADNGMDVALHGSFDLPVEMVAGLTRELGPQVRSVTFDPVLAWTSAGLLYSARRMTSYLQELERRTSGQTFCFGVEDFPETPFCLQMYRNDLAPLLESPRFGILIDVGHFNQSAVKYGYYQGVSPEEHLSQLPLRLLEVHLSDNNGEEDQHLPLGLGCIDFGSVARGLKTIEFAGLSTIEIEPIAGPDPITSALEQIARSRALWERVVAGNS